MKTNILYNEDCKQTMMKMEENSIPFIITDPPYLLEFMGKEFDSQHKQMPGDNDGQKMQNWHKEWCKEAYRILKPGGYLVAFGGTRTAHRLTSAMEDVGFEIRDTIMWIYGQGFPKSFDISRGIDRKFGVEDRREFLSKNPADRPYNYTKGETSTGWGSPIRPDKTKSFSDEDKKWDGWGTALKPALEPIIVGMKKLDNGFVNNALTYGVAGINIDDSRIRYKNDKDFDSATFGTQTDIRGNKYNSNRPSNGNVLNKNVEGNIKGRFPANVILQHHPECEMIGYKEIRGGNDPRTKIGSKGGRSFHGVIHDNRKCKHSGFSDEHGMETIKEWNCHIDCPIRIMDKQSGTSSHGKETSSTVFWSENNIVRPIPKGDSGGASRFFYCAKASKIERNLGIEKMPKKFLRTMNGGIGKREHNEDEDSVWVTNNHPTVKPIDICLYLLKMFSTPDGGIVYDPFSGSGSILIAAKILNREYIGSEIDKDYYEIAVNRLKYDWESWWNNDKDNNFVKVKEEIKNKFFDFND